LRCLSYARIRAVRLCSQACNSASGNKCAMMMRKTASVSPKQRAARLRSPSKPVTFE
jgi:hypothetical protein